MAFMKPVAQYLTETEATEYMHESNPDSILEGYPAGWYSRLSADGYLDCTDWQGPYDSADRAIKEVCDLFDVDENGDPIE